MPSDVNKVLEEIESRLTRKADRKRRPEKLTGRGIDRSFPLRLEEMSEPELDAQMGHCANRISENLNIIHRINRKTGNPLLKLLLLLPYGLDFLFRRAVPVLKDALLLKNITVIRLHRIEHRLDRLEETARDLSDQQEELIRRGLSRTDG